MYSVDWPIAEGTRRCQCACSPTSYRDRQSSVQSCGVTWSLNDHQLSKWWLRCQSYQGVEEKRRKWWVHPEKRRKWWIYPQETVIGDAASANQETAFSYSSLLLVMEARISMTVGSTKHISQHLESTASLSCYLTRKSSVRTMTVVNVSVLIINVFWLP